MIRAGAPCLVLSRLTLTHPLANSRACSALGYRGPSYGCNTHPQYSLSVAKITSSITVTLDNSKVYRARSATDNMKEQHYA